MFVPGTRNRVLGATAALALALGGSAAAATSASAASNGTQVQVCAYGTYASFVAFDYGVFKSQVAYPGQPCVSFTWPTGYDAYIWGQYSQGNNFLVGVASASDPASIATWGNEGPGGYSYSLIPGT